MLFLNYSPSVHLKPINFMMTKSDFFNRLIPPFMKTVKLFLFSLLLSFTVQPLVAQDSIVIAQPIIFSPPITVIQELPIINQPVVFIPPFEIVTAPNDTNPTPDFELIIPYITVNGQGTKNPEELPHFGSNEPVIIVDNIITIRGATNIVGKADVQVSAFFDFNGDGIFEKDEIRGGGIVNEDGNFGFKFDLTMEEIALLEGGAIPMQIRATTSIEGVEAVASFTTFIALFTIDKPTVDVSTGEPAQQGGITCASLEKNTISFTINNNNLYAINVSDIIIDGIPVFGTGALKENPGSVLNDTFPLITKEEKSFTYTMPLPKDSDCFDIVIEIKYFYGNLMPPIVYTIEDSILHTLRYCYCSDNGFKPEENKSLRTAHFGSTTATTINASNSLTTFKVYPTLVQHDFTLTYSLKEPTNLALTLHAINGSKSHTLLNQQQQEKGSYTAVLDISDLPPGVYLLTLSTENALLHQKIVKK